MSENHLTEPLDYLYEELPPERMAEARRHLAVCPDCRAKVREIRETVKLYRRIPRPATPPGLAARAASAAIAEARTKQAPQPEPVVLVTPTPARARIPAADADVSERRQTKLEEDFERLKQEVKEEMRRGWRQWFFHPAWTIAASALLLASLAIHYSPRERHEQPIRLRESESRPLFADSAAARDIRNRERIPAPQPQSAGAVAIASAEAGDDPDQPVISTPLPPAPAALREANARRDLPLPSLARMRAPSAAQPERTGTTEIALADATHPPAAASAAVAVAADPIALDELAEEETKVAAAPAQSGETTPILTPDELASLVAAPVDADEAETAVIAMAEMAPPQVIGRPEGFDTAERIRTLSALAGMQIASGEIADAWKTVDMLRRYSPAAAEEISALITETEKAALAEKEPSPPAEPVPPPEPPPASAVPGGQTEPKPSAPPPAEPEPPAVPAAPVGPEPEQEPAPAVPVEPAPVVSEPVPEPVLPVPVEPEPAAVPEPVLPFPGAMIEPPENPPLSMVIVPAYMQPATTEEIVTMPEPGEPVISEPMLSEPIVPAPDAALRETLDPSRSAELARTLRQSLDPVIPLQVYIRPVAPAPVVVPAPVSATVPKKAKRKPFTTTPYLRDD